MTWTKATTIELLQPGGREVILVGDRKILVLNQENQYYAVDSACPHLKLSLKKGKIVGGNIVCPWHRSAFDLSSGEAKDWTPWPPVVGKAMAAVSPAKPLTVYATRVEDGNLMVDV
jgi:nitrite reductase/ring-hydroxylating ferredoxin subunit